MVNTTLRKSSLNLWFLEDSNHLFNLDLIWYILINCDSVVLLFVTTNTCITGEQYHRKFFGKKIRRYWQIQ